MKSNLTLMWLTTFLIIVAFELKAQPVTQGVCQEIAAKDNFGYNNFYEIQKAFYAYEKAYIESNRDAIGQEEDCADELKFPGYNRFKRWEWFFEQRVFPSGEFPSVEMIGKEYDKFFTHRILKATANVSGGGEGSALMTNTWVNLGTPTVPIGYSAGAGRVNCMAFMPGNPNTMLIGTACGGVWKTTDGGNTWSVLNTDLLPSLSIASIAIDPLNPNNIYIATGDNFAGVPNFGVTKQGHFSAGVFKSTNAGLTWTVTGMSYVQTQFMYPQQLIIDPVTPTILLLVSNTGIWRSINSGTTWTNVKSGNFYSIEFNPLNHNVVYATDGLSLWRSNNNGQTWVFKGGGYPGTTEARVSLAVTPADTNYVYVWGPSGGFRKSVNGGSSFTTMTNPDGIALPYGYYDRAIAVSPTNPLEVHVGGINAAKSLDGGVTWAASSVNMEFLVPNYVHQDVKRMVFAPETENKLYALTDAGVFMTQNGGNNWANLNNGLHIAQIYRLANHPYQADTIYYGTQDCSSNRWVAANDSVIELFPGDGFLPLVDYSNTNIIFVCAQLGNLRKSYDGGQTFELASPGQALWVPPYAMNPINPQVMYFGTRVGVKKSTVGGTYLSWVNTSGTVVDSIIAMSLTKADTNYIYAAKLGKIAKSVNAGSSWTDITGTLPVNSAGITYITVSNTDPNKVWVSFSGYSAGNKIFKSSDGGVNWVNYSGSLPNVPVNCIIYANGSNDGLFIGTDFGVFYRDASASDWVSYNDGLPNVIVNHLDLHYGTLKLRAGTYGRGLWELDVQDIVNYPSCVLQPVVNGDSQICTEATATYSVPYLEGAFYSWTITGGVIVSGQGTNSILVQWGSNGVGTLNVFQFVDD